MYHWRLARPCSRPILQVRLGDSHRYTPAHAMNPRVHLVLCTHTTRHLEPTLRAVGRQSVAPASVVLTCDTDEPAINELIERVWPSIGARHGLTLWHVSRPHTGEARLNQVRNNGLRALESRAMVVDRDLIVMLDADTLLAADAVARYDALARDGAELVIPYRVNLDQEQTEAVASVENADVAGVATPRQMAALVEREARYRRQRTLRRLGLHRLGLVKSHKPKILGGHHAVAVAALRAINGYDEQYVGYGYDDDDLTRRLYGHCSRIDTRIAVNDILALHLWHPSRAPSRPMDAPGHARFARRDLPVVCEHGWRNPREQGPVTVTRFDAE